MRRFFSTILFAAALAPATATAQTTIGSTSENRGVIAQVAPVRQDPAAAMNPLRLTVNDCVNLLSGLRSLDRTRPGEGSVQVPLYEFQSGSFRLDLAHNIAVLEAATREAQIAQQKIFLDVLKTIPEKDGKPAIEIPPNSAPAVDYDRRNRELLEKPCGADVSTINASDLNLEKNQIPLTVLSVLDKIIRR